MSRIGNPLTWPNVRSDGEAMLEKEISRLRAEGAIVTRLGLALWLREELSSGWLVAYQFVKRYCEDQAPEIEMGSADDYKDTIQAMVQRRWR